MRKGKMVKGVVVTDQGMDLPPHSGVSLDFPYRCQPPPLCPDS